MRKVVLSLAVVTALVPAVAMAQEPLRIGGQTKAPTRTYYVAPEYPQEAKAARVSGIVIVEAVIGRDGTVTDAKVIRSIALLDEAALAAVRQWRYTPTTLNGNPVPVIMTATVNFTPPADANPAGVSSTSQDSLGANHPIMQASNAPPEPVYLNGREAIRIGGDVKAPERLKYVQPAYPADAQSARVSGIVIIEALVDETGSVVQTKLLRSIALLDQAAMDAVSQWKYAPTYLNGAAMPVVMTVTVNFTLQ